MTPALPTPHHLRDTLEAGARTLGLALSAGQVDALLQYQQLIARWNQVYNLTAVRDPQDMLVQHLLDCLSVARPMRAMAQQLGRDPARLLDVGSGAGLPGVVLAIVHPEWQVTCVDTVAKKARFIQQVALDLGLRTLTATHQRVEDMTGAPFDIVTSRAFASLHDFISLTRARLAPGGLLGGDEGPSARRRARRGAARCGPVPRGTPGRAAVAGRTLPGLAAVVPARPGRSPRPGDTMTARSSTACPHAVHRLVHPTAGTCLNRSAPEPAQEP